jgi:haloalkane dehalogenase
VEVLRTPDERFADLPGYDFEPNYTVIPDGEGGQLRMHHLDEGPKDGPAILCLHGEPTWSYLYRKMIPVLCGGGMRVIAPDFPGFGRSDKPTSQDDYSYQRHVDWMTAWLESNDLRGLTLVCQDWGGLIGLRLVAENPNRFDRVVTANTAFPPGSRDAGDSLDAGGGGLKEIYNSLPKVDFSLLAEKIGGPGGFLYWRKFTSEEPDLPVSMIIAGTIAGAGGVLSEAEVAAYEAPYPDASYKAGASKFPSLVPIFDDDPAVSANMAAWEKLGSWDKPFLTAFGDADPMMAGQDLIFQKHVPGAKGQPHTRIKGAGHFLQDDHGEELAAVVADFVRSTPAGS